MDKVFLSPREAAIRETEKQLAAMQIMYTNEDLVDKMGLDSSFVASRLRSLEQMQEVLNDALTQSNMLPTAANLETAEAAFVVERLRGLLKNEPCEVAICEESKLVDCGARLAGTDATLGRELSAQIEQARRAVTYLRRQ